MATCDPQALLNAANCFDCLTNQQLEQVQVQMLCDLVNGGLAGGPFIPVSDGPFVHISGDTMTGQLNVRSLVRGLDTNGLESWTILNTLNADRNLFFGANSGTNLTTGNTNLAIGATALRAVTSGSGNVAIGAESLFSLTIGATNVAIGFDSMTLLTSGIQNIAIGQGSMNFNQTGSRNICIGLQSGCGTAVQSSSDNTFIGWLSGSVIDTGAGNTGIGRSSLTALTTGVYNTVVGFISGSSITTGDKNTIIGANVAGSAALSNNVIIADGDGTIRFHTISTGLTGMGTDVPKSKLDIVGNLTVGATYGGVNAAPTSGAIIEGPVGIGTNAPNANALLDLVSTTLGFKLPTMTTNQKNAIANTAGLMVFDTDLGKACVNNGAGWQTITSV